MDGSPPLPRESTPTASSSSTFPTAESDDDGWAPGLALSTDAYTAEALKRIESSKLHEAEADAVAIRQRCKTLHGFIMEAWSLLEPTAKFVDNWHIELICNHLEAVTRGEITRLLINVWPGSMKSLIVSVFWPAWEWGPAGKPSYRYLSTAFNETPTTRDARKTRDLIMTGWFKTLWPDVSLTRWGETSFANKQTGNREGIPFTSLTSQRGNRLIIDDPHSTEQAESDTERAKTVRKFKEGAINRLNDQRRDAIIVIMQRLHQNDLSGLIKRNYPDFVHVVLPMEFERKRAYRSKWGSDPRTKEGEVADPKRFPPEAIAELKLSGDYFWAGQYQQRPSPREGGLFKIPEDWETSRVVDSVPAAADTVGGWDLAGSKKKKSPYSVRVKMSRVGGDYYVEHSDRRHANPTELDEMLKEITIEDGPRVMQSVPQDPAQAGKYQTWAFADLLAGFDFKFSPETGDKEFRARPFAAMWGAGRVFLVRGDWNADYIDELRNFPAGSFKDQVDASSRAFGELVARKNRQDLDNEAPEVIDPENPEQIDESQLIDDPW